MTDIIKVGILEDDPDMRDYLAMIIEAEENMDIVFSEPTIKGAMAALDKKRRVDICLVDLQLPDGNGADFVKHLSDSSDSKALILTVLGDKVSVLAGLGAGAQGYLLKDSTPVQIARHIREVLTGANPVSPQAATHLLRVFRDQEHSSDNPQEPSTLTARETDVLTLFAKGLSYKEAAQALDISTNTVSDYVKSIYAKLSVHSRNEAVFEAIQMGWIDI